MMPPEEKGYLWNFSLFRRHRPADVLALRVFISENPENAPFLAQMQASASAHKCIRDCLHCLKEIRGNAAFGGLVAMTPGPGNPQNYSIMAPLCMPCAKTDIDILATRCRDRIAKECFEGGDLETVTVIK